MPPKFKSTIWWRGAKEEDWFNNTTLARIKTVFEQWCPDDEKPEKRSKATKLEWWRALKDYCGHMNTVDRPSTYQLQLALYDGVIDLNRDPPASGTGNAGTSAQPTPGPPPIPSPKPSKSPPSPHGPSKITGKPPFKIPPGVTINPKGNDGTTPKKKKNTKGAKETSDTTDEPLTPPPTVSKEPDLNLRPAPGAPETRPLFSRNPIYVNDGRESTYERLFNDKVAPNIRSLKVLFYVSRAESADGGPRGSSVLSNSVGNPQRGYTDNQVYSFAVTGKHYSYRGRGPVWESNSCALDCVIVAARLLGIGTTTSDTEGANYRPWLSRLGSFERTCVETFHAPWDAWTTKTNSRRRNEFMLAVYPRTPTPGEKLEPGSFVSPFELWETCTTMSQQFTIDFREGSFCRSCYTPFYGRSSTAKELKVLIDGDWADRNITMQDVLQRHFGVRPNSEIGDRECGGRGRRPCRGPQRLLINGDLPPRLVLKVELERVGVMDIRGVTDDYITFSYETSTSRGELVATYRWLGGIYKRGNHFRVYWTDCAIGDSKGTIKIYDGMECGGAIIGGIPPHHTEHKVPTWWAVAPTLLFYERVPVDSAKNAQSVAPPPDEFPKRIIKKTLGTIDLTASDEETPAAKGKKSKEATKEAIDLTASDEETAEESTSKRNPKKRPLSDVSSPSQRAKKAKQAQQGKERLGGNRRK